jgi:hypothetical protein
MYNIIEVYSRLMKTFRTQQFTAYRVICLSSASTLNEQVKLKVYLFSLLSVISTNDIKVNG